jgi:hypothetical protein
MTGPERRAGATHQKRGEDLVVGDLLFFLSSPHRITHFKDYPSASPLHAEQGGPLPHGTRIAYSGDPEDPRCWGMTVDPDASFWVA